MKKEVKILELFVERDENGFVGFDWRAKEGINIWFLIGALESVKLDLLDQGDKLSEEHKESW